MADDPVAAELDVIRRRTEAATPGPWWADDGELTWRLHGVEAVLPPVIKELGGQVISRQILKAPKSGTPYAEYWPGEADGAFIVAARTDVPRLLATLDAVLVPHAPRTDRVLGSSCFTHRNTLNSLRPVPGCGNCIQDGQREVCPECRDEYGDPVPFTDCRARKAALAALKGENGA